MSPIASLWATADTLYTPAQETGGKPNLTTWGETSDYEHDAEQLRQGLPLSFRWRFNLQFAPGIVCTIADLLQITGFTIAAYETTGTTLCWGFKYLTDYPQIQAKHRLALEAKYTATIHKGRSPTIQEIIGIDIPYLEATVQEFLRFTNPATAVDRQALIDTEILGYAVPKGTIVTCILPQPALISPVDLAELSTLKPEEKAAWDDSNLAYFNPNRWIQDGQFNPRAAPQVAFGLGPRACPGRRLAYLEIKAVLVGVIWNFELLPCPLELSGYEKIVFATQKPKQCFLCVREIARPPFTEV